MRTIRFISSFLAVSLCAGAASALPQVTAENLISAISKIDPATTPPVSCDDELSAAVNSDTANLFYGAAVCGAAKRQVDCAFLLIAGQLRFELDGATMPPDLAATTSNAGSNSVSPAVTLYGIIFYRLGGLGPDEVYTNTGRTKALLAKLDAWNPSFSANHDPGWRVAGALKPNDFQSLLAQLKARRRGCRLRPAND